MPDATTTQPQASPAGGVSKPPDRVVAKSPSPAEGVKPAARTNGDAAVQTASGVTQPLDSVTDYFIIPLSRIEPSKTNPRKNFQGPEFDELVASIKQHGVIVPVLVRVPHLQPHKTPPGELAYEVVAGERRYRAALKAGLGTIPAIVRKLSDEQALELQLVENLQRQDVTPLEEAEGYVQLIDAMGKQRPKQPRPELVAEVARKVGKSVRYIYARMKLAELAPAAQEAIKTGRLEVSHGDELVKLPAKQQEKLVEDILSKPGAAPSVRELKKAVKLYSPARPVQPGLSEAERNNEACRALSRKMRADIDARGEIMEALHDLKFDDNSPFAFGLKVYAKGLNLDHGVALALLSGVLPYGTADQKVVDAQVEINRAVFEINKAKADPAYLKKCVLAAGSSLNDALIILASSGAARIRKSPKAAKAKSTAKPARSTIKQSMKKLLKKAPKKAGRK